MKLDKMVLLAEYSSVIEAEMVKSILDDLGIWSMINNEYMSTYYPTGVIPAQLIVMEHDLDRSKAALLQALESESMDQSEMVDA